MRTLVAASLAAIAVGYCLAVTVTGLALDPGHLQAAFAQGSYLGAPPASFALTTLVATLFSGAVTWLALGGAPGAFGPLSALGQRPLGRVACALAPLVVAPWVVLAQDDVSRRPSLLACLVGVSLASAVFQRLAGPSAEAETEPSRAQGAGWREHGPVLAVMGLHALIFSALAVLRDRGLWSATVDLGIFKEALWHTLHGRVMFSPTVGYSFLGEHFAPVLFLLVPLYALWPTSACLLVVQTAAVSAAGWPVYRVARAEGLGRGLSTALVAAMLFSPPMHTALLYDFHMDLLGVPALAALAWAVHQRRYGHAALALALLVSVKEDMFIAAGAVLAARFVTGDRRDKALTAALGAATLLYCGLAMTVLLKRFGPPPGVPVYMSDGTQDGYKFLRNFRHLAGYPGPVLKLLTQPVRFALYALTEARLTTLLGFIAPLAFLPLGARARVLLLAPLGIVLLSDNGEIVALRYHYSAIQHPGVFLAAAYAMGAWVRGSKRPAALGAALSALVVGASATMLATHPASVASRTHAHDARRVTPHVDAVDRLAARLPADARVSVGTFLGPRVSNRPYSIIFPQGLDQSDWALVDLQRPPWPAGPDQRDDILRGLMRADWGAVGWDDGAVLLHRGASTARNTEAVRDLFARRRYEVEGTEQSDFSNCSEAVTGASDGRARVVRADDPRPPGFVVFGPFLRLPPGDYEVTFRMMARDFRAGDGLLGEADVFVRPGRPVAARALTRALFASGGWVDVTVPFSSPDGWLDGVEFRIRSTLRATLVADVISLRAHDEAACVDRMMGR